MDAWFAQWFSWTHASSGEASLCNFNVGQEVECHFASSQWNCVGAKDVMGVTEMVWVMEKVGLDIDSWLSLNSE